MKALSDALIITKRQLLQLARVPEVLIFSTLSFSSLWVPLVTS